MKTASKTDLVAKTAARSGINRNTVGKVIDALLAEIAATTGAGQPVTFQGFGRFEVRERGARNGRNPATGEAIQYPGHAPFGLQGCEILMRNPARGDPGGGRPGVVARP